MPKQKTDLDRWKNAARNVASDELPAANVPLHVLFGESVDAARFCDKRWKAEVENGVLVRRGLVSAVGERSRLYAGIGDDIRSLQRASQDAHTQYLLTVDSGSGGASMEHGRFLLDELTATLEWLFDDGVEDENDVRLASLDRVHADDPDTADALASALDDYAALAAPHRTAMDGLGGFDAAYIDEARAVAKALREKPASPSAMSDAARRAIALRNKLVTLLVERIGIVRRAARFVFRGQPAIVREATSAYERRRRAADRRAKANEQAPIIAKQEG